MEGLLIIMNNYTKNLKDLLENILAKSESYKIWSNKYFSNIKKLSSTERGELAERFVELSLNSLNFTVKRAKNKKDSFDIMVNNKKVEIKQATLDVNKCFQFNGIRYHRDYDFLFVLGVSPTDIFFNIYTAEDIKTHKIGKLVSMEKGVVGSQKLTKKPQDLYNIELLDELARKIFQ